MAICNLSNIVTRILNCYEIFALADMKSRILFPMKNTVNSIYLWTWLAHSESQL